MLIAATAAQAAIASITFGLPAIGPELADAYDLSLAELGGVLTAGLLGGALSLIVAGMAVDRVGARLPTLVGTALASGGLLVAATAQSKATLFVALVVSGVGTSVSPIAGTGAIFRAYPPARRGWALGVRQMSVPLGGTIAAVAMPWISHRHGTGAALVFAAAAIWVTGISFGLLAGTTATPKAARIRRPFRVIWGAAGIQRLLVIAALYITVLQAAVSFSIPSMRSAGLTAFVASAMFFAINITAVVSRVVWGHIADRGGGVRRTRTLVDVGAVACIGAVCFTLALHVGVFAVLPAAILFGFGALGWNGLIYLSAGERAVPELAARAIAVVATVVYLFSAISAPLLGALADAAGWTAFWLVVGLLAAAGALLASTLPAAAGVAR